VGVKWELGPDHHAVTDGATGIGHDHTVACACVAQELPMAQKIMNKMKHILHMVLHTITQMLQPPLPSQGSVLRNRKELLTLTVVCMMQAILQDMQLLSEAPEDNIEVFTHDQQNFGTQQVRARFVCDLGNAGG